MKTPTVLIVGTGAIGCLVAFRLKNCSIHLVARSNYEHILNNGIHINSTVYGKHIKYDFKIHNNLSDIHFHYDHILICTKTTANKVIIKDLNHLMHSYTAIHLIQNGIATETDFITNFSNPLFLYSCFVRATLVDNILVHSGDTIFTIGCLDSKQKDYCLDWIPHLDLNLVFSDNIQWKRFHKLFWNSTFNPLSVLLDTTVTKMLADDGIMDTVLSIMLEVETLATALYGQRPKEFSSPRELIATTKRIYNQNGEHTPSMFLDYKNGKECEIEVFFAFILGLSFLILGIKY